MNPFGEPKRKPRPLQKVETRARIVDVARAHFERHGFEKANVRAIAADAGVAAGTVLLHFTDKRDLLHAALFDDLAVIISTTTAAPIAGRESLETRLRGLVRPFFAFYTKRPALSKALLREALLAESPWRERFTSQVTKVHGYLVALVEDAKAKNELVSTTDAVTLGASFFAFYYFALIGWVQGALSDPAPLFDRMLAEHLRGMRSPARPRKKPTTRRRNLKAGKEKS